MIIIFFCKQKLSDYPALGSSILDHLQANGHGESSAGNHAKKTIGSIPPLPPTSLAQTPKSKAKDTGNKLNFKASSNTLSGSQSNSNNQVGKTFGFFLISVKS